MVHQGERTAAGGTGILTIIAISLIIFPKLRSACPFETGVAVMPLVKGARRRPAEPKGRIANTRKLLLTAAAIIGLSDRAPVVVACLVPPEHLTKVDGSGLPRPDVTDKDVKAKDRARVHRPRGKPDGKLLPFLAIGRHDLRHLHRRYLCSLPVPWRDC